MWFSFHPQKVIINPVLQRLNWSTPPGATYKLKFILSLSFKTLQMEANLYHQPHLHHSPHLY